MNGRITDMKQLIALLTEQVKTQIIQNSTNIVRLESFDNPLLYKAVCANLLNYDHLDRFIPKLSKEKFEEFRNANKSEWKSALDYLHQGNNAELIYSDNLSNQYMIDSFVDYNNAMTKWRNESASFQSGETVLVLLMGTEAAPDTGGLADTSFAITPKKLITELKTDYSKWFGTVLKDNAIDGPDSGKAINTLYKAIFSNVNIDLIKLSNFVDSLEELNFTSIQDLIAYICETLNVTWDIPKIEDLKSVPKVQNLAKGTLKSARIVLDAVDFIERTSDIPTQSNIFKLEKKFAKFAEDNDIDTSEAFPKPFSIFVDYADFETCVIDFMSGKDIETNRARLLKIDYAYIDKIIGTKLKGSSTPKPVLISGEPIEAISKMAFDAMLKYEEQNHEVPETVIFRVDHISLSDCTEEQKDDSYQHICNYMGGLLTFVNDSCLECNGHDVSLAYDLGKDPFDFQNYDDISSKIKCSGKWGDPCKILFTLTAEGEQEERYEYKWAFSPNSPWLNAFTYLGDVFYRGGDSYTLPTMVICNNIQDFLNCESEDEFYAQLGQIREVVCFDEHRQELRKVFKDTDSLARFDSLCSKFKEFASKLTKNGMFNALDNLRLVVQEYTDLLESVYKSFDSFTTIQREKLTLLVNCFVISSNENVLATGDMKAVIVPAYNPVILEKIDAKVLFVREGLHECINKLVQNRKNYEKDIEDLIQLSSITQAMDTLNRIGPNYLMCRNMWEYYGVYFDSSSENEMVSGTSFGSTIVTDDEDASAMLHTTPMSNIVVRNVIDYLRTFPARMDGVNIAFVGPDDMQHIVAAIHTIAKKFEKQEIPATINIEIICINSKKNSNSYLRKWLDSYFSDDSCVNVNTYLKNIVIESRNDIDNIRPMLTDYDLCFNYNILETAGVVFEPGLDEKIDKDLIKFPMTFTPDTIPASHGQSRKVCISQFQFLSTRAQTQISNLMGNPHVKRDAYRAFKQLELSEKAAHLVEISHECCKWVVCVDPAIDRHMIEAQQSKIIGFTTGEGSYGELNVTVSARKDVLTDIKTMLRKRITEKFSNWSPDRLQTATNYCVDTLSQYMDGSRILKALNPYDYEIHSFLAYLLTLQMLGMSEQNDNYLLRSLISLDSYKHWFEEDEELNLDNKRPDFMLLEIPKTQNNLDASEKLHIDIKIVECKMGFKSEGHLAKAQTQLEKGIKTMSANWNPKNSGVKHRYWLNQLYRAVIFTQLNMDNSSPEYAVVRNKIYGILQGNYEITWSGDIFAFWLDSNSEIPEEWTIESALLDQIEDLNLKSLVCHNCGQMFIQKMLLPPDNRDASFEYNEIVEPETEETDVETEDSELTETTDIVQPSSGETIPKMADVLVPFLKHLSNGTEHTRRDDLIWYNSFFTISAADKKILYESNGHPKWETILDFTITELRKNQLLENSEVGKYHITDLGKTAVEMLSSKTEEESFARFVERVKNSQHADHKADPGTSPKINVNETEKADQPNTNITQPDTVTTQSERIQAGVEGVRMLIGKDMRTGEAYYWEFGNKNLNNRHLLINGNSGCGKTYCIQALLMEAATQGVSSVVFDYTGGFANSKLDPVFKERLGDRIQQRVVRIAKIPVNPFEKTEMQIDEDIFVPEEDADVADKISEIFKAVYDLGDQQKSAVYSAVLNGLRAHGSNMTFPLMVEELENLGTNYAKTVISKIQAFTDVNPFAVDDTFSWNEIRDSKGIVYVFQFAGYGRDIQVLLTELLLWDIWNFCVKNGDESKPFILVMDEAQNLSHGEKSPSAKILTEGRKFGISGWYATQFMKPQLSDDEIQRLQQAGQKLYFCPPDDGVMTVAKNIDISTQGAKEWADRLKRLKKGECVTCGNMIKGGKWTKYEPRIVNVTSLQER